MVEGLAARTGHPSGLCVNSGEAAVRECDAALDTLWASAAQKTPAPDPSLVAAALRQLQAAVAGSARAVELAQRRGAVSLLNRWLRCDSEELLELAAAAIASLASPDTRSLRTYQLGAHTLHVRDASLVDGGLGWRVWRGALVLCDLLAVQEELVSGLRVLELGAGVGLCGLLAAALGASHVTLTDSFPSLLLVLEENAARNHLHNVSVLRLDWADDTSSCPVLHDVLLGSDVLYAHEHAAALPGVLASHLAPGGCALLVNGIRFPEVLRDFLQRLPAAGLQAEVAVLRSEASAEEADESVTLQAPPLGQLVVLAWSAGQPRPVTCAPALLWMSAQDGLLTLLTLTPT